MDAGIAELSRPAFGRNPGCTESTFRPAVRHATSARFRPDCAGCHARPMCLPSTLQPAEVPLLDFIVVSRRPVERSQTLYRSGDRCDTLYCIRAGFFKTVIVLPSGDEQVTGLRMAGDLVGLDGMSDGRHSADAVALDHAEVCVVPLANLLRQSLHDPALQRAFYHALAREIAREQDLLVLLGGMWGIQRVASFLLDLSQRMHAHGHSPAEFEVRMTRREIGSYLGMELETVSRIVSQLERAELIIADRGHISIVDHEGLAAVALHKLQRSPPAQSAGRACPRASSVPGFGTIRAVSLRAAGRGRPSRTAERGARKNGAAGRRT